MNSERTPSDQPEALARSQEPVVGSEIGSLDWSACIDCSNNRPVVGCIVPIAEYRQKLIVSVDYVYCGCFEDKYANRPNTTLHRGGISLNETGGKADE